MARPMTKTLTEGELEFMQILWNRGEATPDDFQEELSRLGREITGGSIRKILAILIRKGYVDRRREGKAHVYRAIVEKKRAQGGMIGYILDKAFSGSVATMVAALLSNHKIAAEELDAIEQLIKKQRDGEKR